VIPWLLKIHVGSENKKLKKIWIPLPLVYVPLLILTVIIAPLLIIGAVVLLFVKKINLFKATPAFFALLSAASGFFIDVNTPKEKFLIDVK
jgi:hypothetical protein